jgi:MFS family permease
MTTTLATAAPAPEEAQARRNALILAAAAAISGSIPAISIGMGGLAGIYLLGADKSLATLPVSAFTIGVAAGSIPAALLMRRIGRRLGFIAGSSIGILGGLIAGSAVIAGSFILFSIGLAVVGFAGAFAQQYRFAAADRGSDAMRARAISWVLAGGVASAFIGPQTAIHTANLFAPIPFAGAFYAMSGLALLAIGILWFLQGGERAVPTASQAGAHGRPLGEIARQPRFVVAVVCAVGSYALMSLLMTAAPLAMVGCGISQENATLGIQWHIVAMFAPSFVTGSLIARFGKEPIIAIGMALLAICAIVALMGIDIANFWIALILLGVGWNFGFIGATSMLTETYRPAEKNAVQGLNDFLVFGGSAIASFSSGHLLATLGWEPINYVVFPVVAVCAAALVIAVLMRRARPAEPAGNA